ncbi:MAG: hypothetical protein AAF939_07215 [Planctomycetota bacterium]
MNIRRNAKSTLHYRSLETRNLLAGDVSVYASDHLYIRGDELDNQFQIVARHGEMWIDGLHGTTINQQASFQVQGAIVTDAGIQYPGGLRTHLGPGHDTLLLQDIHFEDYSIVFGGTGDDEIHSSETKFSNGVTIQTYDGDDLIDLEQTEIDGTFFIFSLDGEDSVRVEESKIDGDSYLVTGDDSDQIALSNNSFLGGTNLVLPLAGDDSVEMSGGLDLAHELGIYLGHGNDTVNASMTDVSMQSTAFLTVDGQEGIDSAPEIYMGSGLSDQMLVRTIEHREVFSGTVGGGTSVEGFNTISQRGNEFYEWYATPISVPTTEQITTVEWSGAYLRDLYNQDLPVENDEFVIEIYEDVESETRPGAIPTVRFEVGAGERMFVEQRDVVDLISGRVLHSFPVYEYSASVDFTMQAGKEYRISVWSKLSQEQQDQGNGWAWGWGSQSGNASFIHGWDTDPDVGGYHVAGNGGYPELDVRLRT